MQAASSRTPITDAGSARLMALMQSSSGSNGATATPDLLPLGSLLLEVAVEEGEQGLLGPVGVSALEAVARALQGEQLGLDVGRLEALDQPDRLFVGDVGVLRAVDAQGRGGVRRHPVQ